MISGLNENHAHGVSETERRLASGACETKEKDKPPMVDAYIEDIGLDQNIRYDDAEHEPELHLKTWVALGAMWCYNFAVVLALNSPAAIVCQERPPPLTKDLSSVSTG
jgi:hypothetical protein